MSYDDKDFFEIKEEDKNVVKHNCCIKIDDWKMDDEGYYKAEIECPGLKESNTTIVHTRDDAMMDFNPDRKLVNKTLMLILERDYFHIYTYDNSVTFRWRNAQKPECDIYLRLDEKLPEEDTSEQGE